MRGQRGFSIAEALVASLLVSIVLVAAGVVFTAIGKRASRESGRSPGVGGATDVALERLERDLLLTTELPERAGRLEAGSRTLLMRMPDESIVSWRQEGNRLFRGSEDDRARLRERLMLDSMLVVDLSPRSQTLFDIALRRRDEPLRRRTILLRNLGAEGEDESPGRPRGGGGFGR